MGKKIATCCYCGTRSVLVFDRARHELTCAACGAPLHNMKAFPRPKSQRPKSTVQVAPVPVMRRQKSRERFAEDDRAYRHSYKRRSRRKPLARRVLEELWDVVEDIFD